MSERIILPPDVAIPLLSVRDDHVHVIRNPAVGLMIGADWTIADVDAAIRANGGAEITGPMAQGMKHGLMIYDASGVGTYFETLTRTDEVVTEAAHE
jgi:hypothetical protein